MKLRRAISLSIAHGKSCATANAMEGGAPATHPGSRSSPLQSRPAIRHLLARSSMIKEALASSTDESLALELDAIVDLGKTDSTQNLIRNFFLAEKYKKGPVETPTEKVVHAAVIGAGVMGSGIAQWLSSHGVTVILRDVAREQIDRGLANIEKVYADAVKRGLMSEEKAKRVAPGSWLHRADGAARCPICDRGRLGKDRNQKGNLSRAGDGSRSENDYRHKYFRAADQRTGGCDGFARTRHRLALFQSGQPDETGGSCCCETNFR